jgi:hypothetical protein
VGPDGDEGSLEVRTEDPAMHTLILYYLTDPRRARPVYIHGAGYRHGPHMRSAEQLCHALSMFGSSFRAFRAMEMVDEPIAAGDAPTADIDPTTMRAPASPWADLRFLLSDFSVERGVGNEESVAALFASLAEARPPSTTERCNTELMPTGCVKGSPVGLAEVGEGGRQLRWRAVSDLVRSFVMIDAALGAVVGDDPGPRSRTPNEAPVPPEAFTRLPASLSTTARALGAFALSWKAQWEFCSELVARDAVIDDDVTAQIARARTTGWWAREMLLPWSCAGRRCDHDDPSWHLDLGTSDLANSLRSAAALLLRGGAA